VRVRREPERTAPLVDRIPPGPRCARPGGPIGSCSYRASLGVKISLSSTLLGAASVLLLAAFAIGAGYDIGPMAQAENEIADEEDVIQNFNAGDLERQAREAKKKGSGGPSLGNDGLDTSSLIGE
jgi:hypothetical protein